MRDGGQRTKTSYPYYITVLAEIQVKTKYRKKFYFVVQWTLERMVNYGLYNR